MRLKKTIEFLLKIKTSSWTWASALSMNKLLFLDYFKPLNIPNQIQHHKHKRENQHMGKNLWTHLILNINSRAALLKVLPTVFVEFSNFCT